MKRRNAAALAVSLVVLLALQAPAPVMAQDTTPPTVTDIVAKDASGGSTPLPDAVLDFAPAEIVVTFSEAIDAATVSADTFRLVGSGGDGTFGDGNEVEIAPVAVALDGSGTQATMGLTGLMTAADAYKVTVSGGDGQTAGLVAHWKFDETSGTTAYDSSGNGLDATVVNGAMWQPTGGKIAGALSFDGIDDYASRSVVTTATDNVTMAAWVYWDGTVTPVQVAVMNGNGSASSYAVMTRHASQGNGKSVVIQCGGVGYAVSSVELSPLTWYHLAAVRRSGTWELFVGGAQVSVSGNPTPNTPTDATTIGSNSLFTANFPGLIDDVRIYERVLSAAEVAALASVPPITDLSTNPLDGDYSGSLPSGDGTAGGDFVCTFEITAPTVLGTSPGDEAGNVPVTATIEVIFSRAMDQVPTGDALVVSGGVTGAKSWAGNTLVLTPDQPLEYSRYYTVTVSTDAKDATGVPLADMHTFAFTTAAEPQPGGDDGGCAAASAGSPLAFLLSFVFLALAGRTRRRTLSHD